MISRLLHIFKLLGRTASVSEPVLSHSLEAQDRPVIGMIAGNGPFPLRFATEAKAAGYRVVAVCHRDETPPELVDIVDEAVWIRVGELGKIIKVFKEAKVPQAAMAGGIGSVNRFSDVKLDARGAALLLKLRTTKDDVVMRGIADELEREGIEVVACTIFLQNCLVSKGNLTRSVPTAEEWQDIRDGQEAIRAMSPHHIGQVVIVRQGVIIAVEAVEGTDACIKRGGELGGPGTVVVKCAKATQDMRFDVPMVGKKTIEGMAAVKARVLALESGRVLLVEGDEVISLADRHGIAIVGCDPLV